VALAMSAALGGHAGASADLRWLAVSDDALHIVGASGWLGSLFWLAVVGLAVTNRSDERRASRVATLVRAFSPVALGCAALVVSTGVVSAWLRLGSLPALWTTSYGQVLLVKIALLIGVIGTGFFNWRVVQPSLGSDVATARLHRSATVELGIGALIILATAVLVALPTPVDMMR
jgi:putative copper export protein